MRRSIVGYGLLLCSWLLAPLGAVSAEPADHASWSEPQTTTWRVGGSLRLRYERKQGYALGKPGAIDPQDYLLSQLRLHLTVSHADLWKLYIEGQDARLFKAFLNHSINTRKTPNIFVDRLDLHQAYLDLKRAGDYASRLRIGRQKITLGAQRLVSPLEWVNTARVWDALRLTQQLGDEGRRVDLFASKLVPVNPVRPNNHAISNNRMYDSQFHGIYLTDNTTLQEGRLELYGLLRDNKRVGDRVNTIGIRADYRAGEWNADAELMGQHGRYAFLRHQAYALHAGIGRKIGHEMHLGAAYNFGSGDSDPNDGRHETFDNLYPLNHAFYGYMDLFSLQNMHNIEAVLKWQADQQNRLRLAYQGFWLDKPATDAWYNAGGGVVRRAKGPVSSHVGSEIDLTWRNTYRPWHLVTLIGYSHFFAGPYIRQTGGSNDMNFFFLQTKYSY